MNQKFDDTQELLSIFKGMITGIEVLFLKKDL